MNETQSQLQNDIRRGVDALRTLRDEARVKLHLAGMDAKQEWRALEPRIEEIEDAAKEVSETTRVAVRDTLKKVEKFVASLG